MEFDLTKLKNRSPYPFETIAVGLSFYSRMEIVLSEAKKIVDACGSKLVLIHVGEKTADKEKLLSDILFRNNIGAKTVKMIWTEGEVVDTMLKICKLNIVDLLILGALEKETVLKYYLGSIARNISRKAKCSVLLLTNKLMSDHESIMVNAGADHPKTIHTINTAFYFARRVGMKEAMMVREVHSPALSMAMAESSSAPEVIRIKKEYSDEESARLHDLIAKCDPLGLNIHERIIRGKPGYAIRQYAEIKKADLLVINSPDTNLTLLDRIFTHDIEFILADMPCNLLIVHSRISLLLQNEN